MTFVAVIVSVDRVYRLCPKLSTGFNETEFSNLNNLYALKEMYLNSKQNKTDNVPMSQQYQLI